MGSKIKSPADHLADVPDLRMIRGQRHILLDIILIAVLIVLDIGYNEIVAQTSVTCPSLVQKAIDSVGSNCGSLE